MATTRSNASNPALNDLENWIGDWEMELSNADFIPNASDTIKGHASFEWMENGAFLIMRMGDQPPDAVWLISRDDSNLDYKVFYFDKRNVSRIYEMSLSENVWKLWRTSPTFSQRFEARISHDGNTIAGEWKKSTDGQEWEHDFDITYARQ